MSIPHIIHYCWFGGNPKTELIEKCIQSWRIYMPDWNIIEWNESNFDVYSAPYISEAYDRKKWAFVSDYARFAIIAEYGGIYFDTDVELLKPIPADILNCGAFMGIESTGSVNPGLVYGSCPGHFFALKMLDRYDHEHFLIDGKENFVTINQRTTKELISMGFNPDSDEIQKIDDIYIYPKEYFCGFDQLVWEPCITPETISIHHYASSWIAPTFKKRLRTVIKKTLGVSAYRKMLMFKRKLFGISK